MGAGAVRRRETSWSHTGSTESTVVTVDSVDPVRPVLFQDWYDVSRCRQRRRPSIPLLQETHQRRLLGIVAAGGGVVRAGELAHQGGDGLAAQVAVEHDGVDVRGAAD